MRGEDFLKYSALGAVLLGAAYFITTIVEIRPIDRLSRSNFKRCEWIAYEGSSKDLRKYFKKEGITDERYLDMYMKAVKEKKNSLEGVIYLPDLNFDGKVGK